MATNPHDEIADEMDDEIDELDELIAERTQHNPDFPAMVEAALQRRRAARAKARGVESTATGVTPEQERVTTPSAS